MQHKTKTIDAAVGKWRGILVNLGIHEDFLDGKHHPCPACKGKDRFRFDDKDGTGSFYCGGCGAGYGMDLLIRVHDWTFAQAAKNVDSVIGNVVALPAQQGRTEAQKVAAIKKLLGECRTVTREDPVWLYLNRRAGIESVPPDLKYHPALYHSAGGTYPGMVAILRGPGGKGLSLHRTYLTGDGLKADVNPSKKFVEGLKLNGGAVRLSRIQEHIGIAEGIENALCAGNMFSMPVWAATNSVLLEQWVPPAGVEQVSIFGDNDSSYAGQAAAYGLAKRLWLKNFTVNVILPAEKDKDFADEYQSFQSVPSGLRSVG